MSRGRSFGRADTVLVLRSAREVDIRMKDGQRVIAQVTRHLSERSECPSVEIAPPGMPPGTRVEIPLSEIASAVPCMALTFATRQRLAREQAAYFAAREAGQ